MRQSFRLAEGGRIDRSRPVRFIFDGKRYEGFAGDTLASALLANDVHLVGRSFKYHRPRGIVAAGAEEPNALVTLHEARGHDGRGRVTPNLRATQVDLYDGLVARSQNRWPGLRFDAGAFAGLFAPLLSAGFYYKTFMGPSGWWRRIYEPAIRRAAGLGRAPREADPDAYAHQHAWCDVLVVGAGPAGLAAAMAASQAGARVILCDEQTEPGGWLLSAPSVKIDGLPGSEWVQQTLAAMAETMTFLPQTTAFGWYPGTSIGLTQRFPMTEGAARPIRERLWYVRAEKVILATGAIERPVLFPGNDRPGVMLAGAALTYLHRYGVRVGHRVVVVTADNSAYLTAVALHSAGIAVAGVIDQRFSPSGPAVEAARAAGIPIRAGTTIAGTEGRRRVHTVRIADSTDVIPCDTVLMCGGWTPSVHLASQSRKPVVFDPASGVYLPSGDAAGACAGTFDLARCLTDGAAAGGVPRDYAVEGLPGMSPPVPPLPAPVHRHAFVDLQNDVSTKDLRVATQEGFTSIEHVKRYTTAGMATDQGKTSNLNALVAVAGLTGRTAEAVGFTTFRPPYTPVTFGALAGTCRDELYAPIRLTPIMDADALFEDVGMWKRARCYPQAGETAVAATMRERQAVRQAVGMLDASTLGKIEVAGPDAAAFLDRIYTGRFSNLAVGSCRYALLLGEDGFIRDDGIVARLAADRFHVTTTTGGAGFVLHHMEDYLQTEFSGLRVWLTSVTEQWAVIAVQGPDAAATLAPFIRDVDLGSLPHMSVREAHIGDVLIRLFRISFTGEAGFEINLPPPQAQRVWDTLKARGITRYGTDAMHALRAEKGYIIVGQETDGTVTPDDAGLGWAVARSKPDFVGKRSLALKDLSRPERKQLIGLACSGVLEEGAQVCRPGEPVPVGHVTSAYPGVALALVAAGRSLIGQSLSVPMPDGEIAVTAVDPVSCNKAGERLRPLPVPATEPLALLPLEAPVALKPLEADGVRIVELAPVRLLSIRTNAATAGIGMALGVLLPTAPCRSVIARDRAALWLGPDEWLIQAPEDAADVIDQARKGAGDVPASIADMSHRSRALEIAGPFGAWCLNGYCALDLDPHAFPVGMCTRTLLGKAEILLWRIAPEVFHVHAERSFFPYVWRCLEVAVGAI